MNKVQMKLFDNVDRDPRLAKNEKIVMKYIIRKPDDYRIDVEELKENLGIILKINRGVINTVLRKLKACGYLNYIETRKMGTYIFGYYVINY